MSTLELETAGAMLARMGTDAQLWAQEFLATYRRVMTVDPEDVGLDEGWLIGWFANAIMAGHDMARHRFEDVTPADLSVVSPNLIRDIIHLFNEYGALGVRQVARAVSEEMMQ